MLRQLGGCLAVSLVWSLIAGSGSPVSAAPATVPCVPSASDGAAALAMARACGTRVEIESHRTETGQVFANPDGSAVVEEFAYPQRARQANGSWSALDATLVANPDGSWSPRASTVDMTFSGGGSGDLIRGRRAGKDVRLSWPGVLPRPSVSGNVATYAEVLPGVDLVVTALETGFSEVLTVKNRDAARNPALRRLAFGTRLSGLRWQVDGGLRAVDEAGEAVLAASSPLMWDSAGAGGSDTNGPGPGARVAPVRLGLSGSDVVLEPDGGFLTDPGAVFPMFIDPTVTYSAWTMINHNFPDQEYWSYDKSDCTGSFNTECAKVGYITGYGPTVKYRSIWRFLTSGFRGKTVLSARFTIDLLHSFDCTNRATELRETGAISSSTNWNNHASTWSGTITATASNHACNAGGPKHTEFSSSSLKSRLQTIANGSATVTNWGLKAASESSNSGWKKFDAKKARLVVEVNTIPAVPTSLTADSKACATGSSRAFIKTATPALRAKLSDADGHSMTGYFEWAPINTDGTYGTVSSPLSQTSVPNGSFALVTLPSLPDGQYAYRAWAKDSLVTGSKSAWCEFEVDTVKPDVPAVSSDIYKEGVDGCPSGACGSVGHTGRFTFSSPSPDTQSYRWGFSDPPSTVVTASTLGASVSVDWTPSAAGPHTLYVRAVDRAGNENATVYQLYVAQPSIALARWKMNDATGATVLADDTGQARTATLRNGATLGVPGRIAAGNDGVSRTALGLDGVDDRAETSGPIIADTSKSFSVAAWVKVDQTGTATQHIVTQNGNAVGAFYLEYHNSGVWRMTFTVTDTSPTTYQHVTATSPPRAGVWTHLAGTYDSAAKTARIYVNGVLEGTTTGITAWKSNQFVRIGGITWPLKGSLAEIQVWNRMITATEVFNLADPIGVGKVAEWRMEEVGPGPAWDASGLAHDLTFYNGAHVPPSGAGKVGTGLRLDGIDDHTAPDEAVLHTDQSFTVSAWVRASSTTAAIQTFLLQESASGTPGFMMYFDRGNNLWKIKMYASAAGDESTSTIASATATTPTSYHHLVGVFDAQKRELRLYVDGMPPVSRAMNAAYKPWNSAGRFLIGRMPDGSKPAHADVDEIRVYQGVVADVTRIP